MDNYEEAFGMVKEDIKNHQEEFRKCAMLEMLYKYQNGPKEISNIFPPEWYGNYNYSERIEILTAAINNDKKIVETQEYVKIKGKKI